MIDDRDTPSRFAELLARDMAGEDILAGRTPDPPTPRKKKRKPPGQNPLKPKKMYRAPAWLPIFVVGEPEESPDE